MQPTTAVGLVARPTEEVLVEAVNQTDFFDEPVGQFRGRVVRWMKSVTACSLVGFVVNSIAFAGGIVGAVRSYDTLGWGWYLVSAYGVSNFIVDACFLHAAIEEPPIEYLRLDADRSLRRADALLQQVKLREEELRVREEFCSLREGVQNTTRLSNFWQNIVQTISKEVKVFVGQVQTLLRHHDQGTSLLAQLFSEQVDVETNDVLALVDHVTYVSRKWLELIQHLSQEIQKEKGRQEAQTIFLREKHELVVHLASMLDEVRCLSMRVSSNELKLEHAVGALKSISTSQTVHSSQEVALQALR